MGVVCSQMCSKRGCESGDAMDKGHAPTVENSAKGKGSCYRALTKISIRMEPETDGPKSGAIVQENEIFEVSEVRAGPGAQTFLKLAGRDGWVFTTGTAGNWDGKDIAVPATEADFDAIVNKYRQAHVTDHRR